jgi:hypothetical protein
VLDGLGNYNVETTYKLKGVLYMTKEKKSKTKITQPSNVQDKQKKNTKND